MYGGDCVGKGVGYVAKRGDMQDGMEPSRLGHDLYLSLRSWMLSRGDWIELWNVGENVVGGARGA